MPLFAFFRKMQHPDILIHMQGVDRSKGVAPLPQRDLENAGREALNVPIGAPGSTRRPGRTHRRAELVGTACGQLNGLAPSMVTRRRSAARGGLAASVKRHDG